MKITHSSAAYIYLYENSAEGFKYNKIFFQHGDSTSENKKKFISLSFSNDHKIIAGLTNFPDCNAIFYDTSTKGKLFSCTPLNADIWKLTINPYDGITVCSSGKDHFKIWKIQEIGLRQISNILNLNQKQNFSDHAWLNMEKIVV